MAEAPIGVILAGGLGTRLRVAVPDLPKPMAPIRGRPFLAHQMDHWIGQGISRFVLSVGYRHEAIREYFGSTYRSCPLVYSVEETPLGTGGGLLLAAQGLPKDSTLLVLNGDTFFDVKVEKMLQFHEHRRSDWTMAAFRTSDSKRYMGLGLAEDGAVTSFTSPLGTEGFANGGVYLVAAAALAKSGYLPGEVVSLEGDLVPRLHRKGCRFFAYASEGCFIDIGVPADYYRAVNVIPEKA